MRAPIGHPYRRMGGRVVLINLVRPGPHQHVGNMTGLGRLGPLGIAFVLVSAVVFGGLHAFTVTSWTSAAITLPSLAAFGFVQCLLVRRTGELSPAIGVHAATNLVALVVAKATRG